MTAATEGRTSAGRRPAIDPGEVLDAAEDLLAEGGFDDLSVRSVAARLGASRQLVYTHFGGMDGLLDGLHERLSARLGDAVHEMMNASAEPTGSIEFMLDGASSYRSVARRWPELYQLVFEQPIADYRPGRAAQAKGLTAFGRVVEMSRLWLGGDTEVASSRASRSPLAASPEVALARAVWSTMHGFVVLERVGFASTNETDDLSDRAIRAMLGGWLAPSTQG